MCSVHDNNNINGEDDVVVGDDDDIYNDEVYACVSRKTVTFSLYHFVSGLISSGVVSKRLLKTLKMVTSSKKPVEAHISHKHFLKAVSCPPCEPQK